jgi:hypothetical protein
MANVYLACPTYDGTLTSLTARAVWGTAAREHRVLPASWDFSLIPVNCNHHWCAALNTRAANQLEWFAMLHSDIGPEPWWLDKLIAEAIKYGADLLSAVVPLKNEEGLTSTAILKPGGLFGVFHRLSLAQVLHPEFPETFDVGAAVEALARLPGDLRDEGLPRDALLVNTGCMVMRLDRAWADERLYFADLNGIEKVNGELRAACKPEDWYFSHRVAQEGGRVMATRAIKLTHRGVTHFPSYRVWGQPRDASRASD